MDQGQSIPGTEPVGLPSSRLAATRRFRLDGIQFRKEIGRGRGTIVYRALRQADYSEVAVKVLIPGEARAVERVDAFIHCGQRMMALTHPNLLGCFAADIAFGCGYQILELAQGRHLAQVLAESGPYPYKEGVALVIAACRGIEVLAKDDLVHGTLAPHNLFLSREYQTMVAPASGPLPPRGDGAGQLAVHRRQAGCVAPEVLLGQSPCTHRGDIYSLGAVLRLLLTGDPTRPAASWEELEAVMSGATAGSHDEVPGLSADCNAILRKALALDQAHRYSRVSHLREDLERVLHDFSPIHARSRPTVTVNRRRSWSAAASSLSESPPAHAGDSLQGTVAAAVSGPTSRPLRWWPAGAVGLLAIAGLITLIVSRYPGHPAGHGALADLPEAPNPSIQPAPTALVLAARPSGAVDDPIQAPDAALAAHPAPRPRPIPWARHSGMDGYGPWAEMAVGGTQLRFRHCQAGTFWMGSPLDEDGRRVDETRTLVTLSRDFWISDSAVPQQLYQAVMLENPSAFRGPRLPLESVTFDECQHFLRLLGRDTNAAVRLPSEAEYEYASRAGSDAAFAIPAAESSWTRETSSRTTHPIASLKPNRWGLFDMQGNVLAWCQDTYAPYDHESVSDPCATGGIFQIARGGAWCLPASDSRAAARHHYQGVARLFFIGIRVVCEGDVSPALAR